MHFFTLCAKTSKFLKAIKARSEFFRKKSHYLRSEYVGIVGTTSPCSTVGAFTGVTLELSGLILPTRRISIGCCHHDQENSELGCLVKSSELTKNCIYYYVVSNLPPLRVASPPYRLGASWHQTLRRETCRRDVLVPSFRSDSEGNERRLLVSLCFALTIRA